MNIKSENKLEVETTSPSKNSANINDYNNGNIVLKLSVSTEEVRSKEEGKNKTNFELREFDLKDSEALKKILKSNNYSTNTWSGTCSQANYVGMTGVTLDFDAGVSLDEARIIFHPYKHIVHTSTNHQVDKKGVVADRFRVILPFEPTGPYYETVSDCDAVYEQLLRVYPNADHHCKGAEQKYFPFTGEEERFECYINTSGEYFTLPEPVTSIVDIASGIVFPEENEGIDGNQPGLMKMVRNCPIIQRFEADPSWVDYNQWLGIGSNYACFQGGKERFTMISKRDAGRFDQAKVDQMFEDFYSTWHGPQTYFTLQRNGIALGLPPHAPKSPAGWAKIVATKQTDSKYLSWNDTYVVNVKDSWILSDVSTLKFELVPQHGELEMMCPVCEDDHALVGADCFGFVSVNCGNCKVTLHESSLYPDMFTYKNKLLRVESRSNQFISMEVLEEDHFRSQSDFKFAKKMVFNDPNRKFLNHNFLVRQMGNAAYESLGYEFDIPGNSLIYKFPALPVKIRDNALIDQFLEGTFREHVGFIKDWLAMYCHTNYIVLPVLVLTSERSSGKGTFANMVGSIFPTLQGQWEGVKETFNDQYKCKLMVVDENANSDKPMQYTEIKRITGNKIIRINEKYAPAYYVPNNINIIIATNDPKPVFLKAREEPRSENTNNFFIYKLPPVDPARINEELGQQLQDRLGHYVRTELKSRYEALAATRGTNNRYGLPTPITQLERDLFSSAYSTIEIEAEELARHIVCGLDIRDPYSRAKSGSSSFNTGSTNSLNDDNDKIKFEATVDGDSRYVKFDDIRRLVSQLRFKGSGNPKSYVSILQEQGVLTYDTVHKGSQYLGYKILRDPSFYDEKQPFE